MAEEKKLKMGDTLYWVVLITLIGLATFFITADFSRDYKIRKATEEKTSSNFRSSTRQEIQMMGGGGMPTGERMGGPME